MRSLTPNARVLVLGTVPEQTESNAERVAQRALEGFTRSLGKEIGKGSTVNLVYVAPGAESTLESTLSFFLSPKSAYVSGQVARLGATGTTEAAPVADPAKPLTGKVAIVTGASRGIGEQIARVLHRDGATVLGIDVPQAASELQVLMKELDGDHLDARHHRQGRAPAHRPARQDQVRAGARGGAQRRHHPRQEAGQHGRGPLELGDRGQPDRARADHPRAARPGPDRGQRPDRRRLLDRRHRRQHGPDELRRVQGRRHRAGRLAGRGAARTASRSTPSRPASSSPR